MQLDEKKLFQMASDYPFSLFTAEEISVLCRVGEHKVRVARNAKDTPFRLNVCRPEWMTDWMWNHPDHQDLKSIPVNSTPSAEDCAAFVKKTLEKKSKPIFKKGEEKSGGKAPAKKKSRNS